MQTESIPYPESMADVLFTMHARERMAQRGISEWAVAMVLSYGTVFCRRGIQIYCLAKRNLPRHLSPAKREKLNGITCVVSDADELITVYHYRKRNLKRFRIMMQ